MPSQWRQPSKCFWEMRQTKQMREWASAQGLTTAAVFIGTERGNLNTAIFAIGE